MVWHELIHHLAGRLGRAGRLRDRRARSPRRSAGMARLLGVVDRAEEGRRPSPRGVPRLGGLALFFGIFVPALAFLPLDGEMRGDPARRRGRDDGRRDRRLPRAALVGEARRPDASPRRSRPASGVWVHSFTLPVRRRARTARARSGSPLTVFGIVARDEHGQLPRRARRARRRRLRDLGALVLHHRPLARRRRRGDPDRDRLRRLPRLPAPQLLPGADLHGRLGRAPARLHARRRLGAGAARRPPPCRRSSCRCSCSRSR